MPRGARKPGTVSIYAPRSTVEPGSVFFQSEGEIFRLSCSGTLIAASAIASLPRRTSLGELWLRVFVLTYILLLIGAPLVGVVGHGFSSGLTTFWNSINAPVAKNALILTLKCAFEISVINAVMGTMIAWVLARYRVFGKGLISALVDLPFALPTLVAGVMLSSLFGHHSVLGDTASATGVPVVFAKPGIILALLFVTLPLVVRSVEPVILGLDPAEEEAAFTLGANRILIFFWLTLRSLAPAITYGSIQCFARAVAEFGAVVVVSGNIPYKTLTAPVFILGEVESGKTESAAAISILLLILAVWLSYLTRAVQRRISAAQK